MGIRWTCVAVVGLAAAAVVVRAEAGKFNNVLSVGDRAPEWTGLMGVDGEEHSLSDLAEAKLVVVAFISNHCPVATAYEDRLTALAKEFADLGVEWVAINVNLGEEDGLPKMKVRADEKQFPFPYLFDGTQDVGRDYGASVTPSVFLLDGDRRIVYMGAIDDHQQPERVKRHYLRAAIRAVLDGQPVPTAETRPRGCEIQYTSEKPPPEP